MLVDNQLIKVVSLLRSEFSLSQYNQSKERIFKKACIRKHLASLQHKFSILKVFHETFNGKLKYIFFNFSCSKKYVTQLQTMHLSCI